MKKVFLIRLGFVLFLGMSCNQFVHAAKSSIEQREVSEQEQFEKLYAAFGDRPEEYEAYEVYIANIFEQLMCIFSIEDCAAACFWYFKIVKKSLQISRSPQEVIDSCAIKTEKVYNLVCFMFWDPNGHFTGEVVQELQALVKASQKKYSARDPLRKKKLRVNHRVNHRRYERSVSDSFFSHGCVIS